MNKIKVILNELLPNLSLVWSVARYENHAVFQGHTFGVAWEILDPLIQIAINFFVFGTLRGNSEVQVGLNDYSYTYVSFLAWMLVGQSAWLFMSRVTLLGSKSVSNKIKLVSKMKFPSSILPAMSISGKVTAYFVTLTAVLAIVILNGFSPTLYWLQAFYYIFAMFIFMYFFALLNSTLTMIFKDYHQILGPIVRILFFFSGVVWRIGEAGNFPRWFLSLLDLNPFAYIITGFRYTFFSQAYFWQHPETTIFFWGLMLCLAIYASYLHLKYRSKFFDLA